MTLNKKVAEELNMQNCAAGRSWTLKLSHFVLNSSLCSCRDADSPYLLCMCDELFFLWLVLQQFPCAKVSSEIKLAFESVIPAAFLPLQAASQDTPGERQPSTAPAQSDFSS